MEKLILNKDYVPVKGSRIIKKMSESEFLDKLKDYIKKYGEYDDENNIDPFVDIYSAMMEDPTLDTDFEGFESGEPSFENITMIGKGDDIDWWNELEEKETGIQFIDGAPYLIFYTGGDWELPLVFMLYYDGTKFRFYVPTKGNVLRIDGKERSAFGNRPTDWDKNYKVTEYGKTYDTDELYIVKEMCKQGLLNISDPVKYLDNISDDDDYESSVLDEIKLGNSLCIEDFEQTVKVI